MYSLARNMLSLLVLCGLPIVAAAQAEPPRPKPQPEIPPTKPVRDKKQAAFQAYALGRLYLKDDRLLEAMRAFEKAVTLDPDAALTHKELVELYSALNRREDALRACRKVLQLQPKDAKTWWNCARILTAQGKSKEARKTLKEALQKIDADANSQISYQLYYDLAILQTEAKQSLAAAISYAQSAAYLQKFLQATNPPPLHRQEITLRLVTLHERMGKLYADEGKHVEALKAYKKAQQLYPADATRWNLHLAQVSKAQGSYRQALKYVEDYLTRKPQGLEAYHLKIDLLERLNRASHVLLWLEKASRKDRFNTQVKMLLAEQFGKRRQAKKAERLYLELTQEEPKAHVYKKLFQLYNDAAQFDDSHILKQLNSAIAKANDNGNGDQDAARAQAAAMVTALRDMKSLTSRLFPSALANLGRRKTLEYHTITMLAVLADNNRKPKFSERFYRELVRRRDPSREALAYSGLLRALWKMKQQQEIVRVCDEGLRQTQATNHVLFHSEKARALAHLKKTKAALQAADEALRVASDNSRLEMHRLRVSILLLADREKEAEQDCLKLLETYKLPGEILQIRFMLSSVYSQVKNYKKSEEQLQLILKIDPINARAFNDLGYMWADRGKNLAEAERMIRKAIELDREERFTVVSAGNDTEKDRAAYIDSLAWVLFRRGKLQAARGHLEKATKLPGGDDPVIWDHLGDVYFRLELRSQAMASWQKALQLYEESTLRPRDQHYRDLQEKIKQLKTSP